MTTYKSTTYIPKLDPAALRQTIREEYARVATEPGCDYHFISGRPLADRLGYDAQMLEGVPEGAIESFAGVGNPFMLGELHPGEMVADIGSGAGVDSLIAARMVSPTGKVIGLDMTFEMVGRAQQNAREMGAVNANFVVGLAETIPLPDDSVDVVISNGVINLAIDKAAVFAEIHRVLRPGGRIQIADVIVERPIPPFAKDLIHLWTDCVAGGITRDEYASILNGAGFHDVQFARAFDVFKGAKVELSADHYGARGFNIKAVK